MAKQKSTKTSSLIMTMASLAGVISLSGCSSLLTGQTDFDNTTNQDVEFVGLQPTNQLITLVSTQVAPATAASSTRDTSLLVDNYPNRYVVVKGDTLWDISARFLRDPWLWPQVWDHNQQIRNPHLIYPGDVITLRWCDGKPCLGFEGGDGTRRLSPQIRYDDLSQAIPTIPYDAIAGFLSKPSVLDATYANTLPYVLASADGRLIMAEGNDVYVRGNVGMRSDYNIFNIGDPYIDPETGYVYGVEALFVGEGNVFRGGDPATMKIVDSRREVLRGDRMMPFSEQDIELNFMPKAAPAGTTGTIISVVEGVDYIAQYDIIVINRGKNAGFTRGDVVSIFRKGDQVWDPYDQTKTESNEGNWFQRNILRKRTGGKYVKLPDEAAGVGMVFRVYDNISYALVMRAEREIHEGDLIRSPQ